MAGTFTSTGVTFSNLSRLELEQLRKADFFAGSKGLTVGDDGTTLGAGSINAEPYQTAPSIALDDAYTITPAPQPGLGLGTLATDSTLSSETVRWYGPSIISGGSTGAPISATVFKDLSVNFIADGVQTGDLLMIKQVSSGTGPTNLYAVGTVSVVGASTLTLSSIVNPSNSGAPTQLDSTAAAFYSYVVVRQNVVKLFAIPGSGPLGQEQSFLTVVPGSTLHTNSAPTLDEINADRVTNLVPTKFALNSNVDRADSVFSPPSAGPNLSLDTLGYRVVLYKSNNTGTGPDLTQPIASLNPVINPGISASDQRFTIDYKAGIIRFSTAPVAGGDIKPTGGTQGTNPTTGRLELYAVFWAVDQSATRGTSRGLYNVRTDDIKTRQPAQITFDSTNNVWRVGATGTGNDFIVQASDGLEDTTSATKWGVRDINNSTFGGEFRGFIYRSNTGTSGVVGGPNLLTFVKDDLTTYRGSGELVVADKTQRTVGGGEYPPALPGSDANPLPQTSGSNGGGLRIASALNNSATFQGYNSGSILQQVLNQAAISGFSNVRLNRGRHQVIGTVYVPPGVTIEGEGYGTLVESTSYNGSPTNNPTVFRFWPNTPWGVFDFSATQNSDGTTSVSPTTFTFPSSTQQIEGYDIVWNSARRVWAIVQADVTSGALWFNEMNPDGSLVLPGLGIDIKNDANVFFTNNSPNSINHTTGHYPRIAYQRGIDRYAVVWVVENNLGGGVTGPLVQLRVILSVNDPTKAGTAANYTLYSTTSISYSSYVCTDHPSVAMESPIDGSSQLVVTCWGFSTDLTSTAMLVTHTDGFGNTVYTTSFVQSANSIVSSTDCAQDDHESIVTVYSVRRHPLYFSTTGTASTAGTLTDPLFSSSFSSLGVEVGSRFIVIGNTPIDNGKSGVIRNISAGTLYVDFDGPFNGTPTTNTSFSSNVSSIVNYAIAPLCRIYASNNGASPIQIAGPPASSSFGLTTWYQNEREADFVRVCNGGDGRLAVVYQSFDFNGALNRPTTTNWDNNSHSTYIDAGNQPLASQVPNREHISTCYVLIETTTSGQVVAGPSDNTSSFSTTDSSAKSGVSRDIEVISRSLGGRLLPVPYENLSSNYSRHIWEISARNYMEPCPPTGILHMCRVPSLIPDITWSGSDWTIVSPSKANIYSDTGNVYSTSGSTYLTDMSYYFGNSNGSSNNSPSLGGTPSDGNAQRGTIYPGFDHIYFPNATSNKYAKIVSAVTEHTVQLGVGDGQAGLPTGLSASGNVWYLMKYISDVAPIQPAAIKNPGFRLSYDGKVIVSSSFMTFADPQKDLAQSLDFLPSQETVDRGFWGDQGGQSATQQATHKLGINVLTYNDLMPGQRLMADIGFKGVAIGAPKNCNGLNPNEAPLVAIAWGDNFYAAVDRNVAGATSALGFSTPANETLVYRQSFGPWRSQIRDLRIKGAGTGTRATTLLSKQHVFTKHGGPVTGSPFFATDGYRNVFMHYETASFGHQYGETTLPTVTDLRDPRSYTVYVNSITTDALGRDGIRSRVGYQSMTRNINPGNLTGGWGVDTNVGKLVWTGSKFLAVVGNEAGVTVYELPGSEGDVNNLTEDLVGDTQLTGGLLASFGVLFSNLAASATTSCGAGGYFATSNTNTNDISINEARDGVQFDVAWSGKVLAIAWTSGHNLTSAGSPWLGNTVVGITIVTPGPLGLSFTSSGSQQVNATTYVLDSLPNNTEGIYTPNKGGYRDPKLVWDGSNFAMTFCYTSNPSGSGAQTFLGTALIPENGLGSSQQVKKVRPFVGNTGSITGTYGNCLGTIDSDGTLNFAGTNAQVLQPQPGDIVVISRTSTGGSYDYMSSGGSLTSASSNLAGWYVVQRIFGSRADLGVDLTQGGDNTGNSVYGALMTGAENLNQTSEFDVYFNGSTSVETTFQTGGGTGPSAGVSALNPLTPSGQTSYKNVGRNFGLFYNEADDAFISVFLQAGGVNHVIATTWKRYGNSSGLGPVRGKDVDLSALAGGITNPTLVAADFNGSDLFVVFANNTGNLYYSILSKDLVVKVPPTYFDQVSNSFGGTGAVRPGALYPTATSIASPSMNWVSLFVKWNSKMGRFVVTASMLDNYNLNNTSHDAFGLAQLANGLNGEGGVLQPFSGYSGTTLTYGTIRSAQLAGQRIVGQKYTINSGGGPYNYTLQAYNVNTPTTGYGLYDYSTTAGATTNYYRQGATLALGSSLPYWTTGSSTNGYVLSYHNISSGHYGYAAVNKLNYIVTSVIGQINLEGGILPLPSIGDTLHTTLALANLPEFAFNIMDGSSISNVKVFTNSSTVNAPSDVSATLMAWSYLPREDTWMWTFGADNAAIQIKDADEVALENVEINSGYVDIEERYPNMGRPYWKVNGLTLGNPFNTAATVSSSTASWAAKPHAAHVFGTPIGKAETVRLVNVRSKTLTKYGEGFLENLLGGSRGIRYLRNRKG